MQYADAEMSAAHAMKRIPRIKFPQRHPKLSGTDHQIEEISVNKNKDLVRKFFSRQPSSVSAGGKASDQPKRTPVSLEEIEAVMLGGCI